MYTCSHLSAASEPSPYSSKLGCLVVYNISTTLGVANQVLCEYLATPLRSPLSPPPTPPFLEM